jgi:hypothetical protein
MSADTPNVMTSSESNPLFGQTLRTVAVLVTSCVVFVGALSAAAVAIASKAVGDSSTSHAADVRETTAAAAPKKPLSI